MLNIVYVTSSQYKESIKPQNHENIKTIVNYDCLVIIIISVNIKAMMVMVMPIMILLILKDTKFIVYTKHNGYVKPCQ